MLSSYQDKAAENKALEFCRHINIGQEEDGLLERAIAAGADKKCSFFYHDKETERNTLIVTFRGFLLDRYFCDLVLVNSKVISKRTGVLD